MTDHNDAPVDGLDDYLARFMSYPRAARTDLDAVTRRALRPRYAGPIGAVLVAAALTVVLALAVAHHQSNGGASDQYKGPQLNIVLRTVTGSGATTTKAASFPDARYTFFAYADPANCVTGVHLEDTAGEYVAGGGMSRSSQAKVAGAEATPVVQKDLPEGDYRMRIDTAAAHCTWMVEQILNSMSSPAAPPQAAQAPGTNDGGGGVSRTPDGDNLMPAVDNSPMGDLTVPMTGVYALTWTVTPQVKGMSCAPVHFSLRNRAGELEYQGTGSGNPTSPLSVGTIIGPLFLASGGHPLTVTVPADCSFAVNRVPWRGPLGGGAQGFAPVPGLPTPLVPVPMVPYQCAITPGPGCSSVAPSPAR